MKLALIGCGTVSRECYVPALKRITNHSVEWFVDANLERAKELANKYGQGRVTQDYKETIASVDAAVVAVPNYLHAPVSIDFLREGRHVLCEKPIATRHSDALLMIEASEKSGTRLGVNLIRRRYQSHRLAKLLLENDLLGDLKQVSCEEGRVYDWNLSSSYFLDRTKAGGGVLVDWGTHVLDTIQWLFDANLDLISYNDDSHGGVEANCEITLTLKREHREIPCQIILSRTRVLPNKVVIDGKNRSLEIDDSDPTGAYMRVNGHLQIGRASCRERV